MSIQIYTDGACLGNPGPGGYGIIIQAGDKRLEFSQGYRETTNNRMELKACIVALEEIRVRGYAPRSVQLHTDSKYVQQGITDWINKWRQNSFFLNSSKTKPVKNRDLWQELDELNSKLQVGWHWVKGHAGHPLNERADFLAFSAAEGENLLEDEGYGKLEGAEQIGMF